MGYSKDFKDKVIEIMAILRRQKPDRVRVM
jgi:hypothetical protein